jgi:hypothetical protein
MLSTIICAIEKLWDNEGPEAIQLQ